MESRGGVGGDEAALFAGDLFACIPRYAEKQGWKIGIIDASPTEIGGYKEISFSVDGDGAYSRRPRERHPSGTAGAGCRSAGRIHTSAVTVARSCRKRMK